MRMRRNKGPVQKDERSLRLIPILEVWDRRRGRRLKLRAWSRGWQIGWNLAGRAHRPINLTHECLPGARVRILHQIRRFRSTVIQNESARDHGRAATQVDACRQFRFNRWTRVVAPHLAAACLKASALPGPM